MEHTEPACTEHVPASDHSAAAGSPTILEKVTSAVCSLLDGTVASISEDNVEPTNTFQPASAHQSLDDNVTTDDTSTMNLAIDEALCFLFDENATNGGTRLLDMSAQIADQTFVDTLLKVS